MVDEARHVACIQTQALASTKDVTFGDSPAPGEFICMGTHAAGSQPPVPALQQPTGKHRNTCGPQQQQHDTYGIWAACHQHAAPFLEASRAQMVGCVSLVRASLSRAPSGSGGMSSGRQSGFWPCSKRRQADELRLVATGRRGALSAVTTIVCSHHYCSQ